MKDAPKPTKASGVATLDKSRTISDNTTGNLISNDKNKIPKTDEIINGFFSTKKDTFWDRIRYNIRQDITLSHIFKVYRLDNGMKYFNAPRPTIRQMSLISSSEQLSSFPNSSDVSRA